MWYMMPTCETRWSKIPDSLSKAQPFNTTSKVTLSSRNQMHDQLSNSFMIMIIIALLFFITYKRAVYDSP